MHSHGRRHKKTLKTRKKTNKRKHRQTYKKNKHKDIQKKQTAKKLNNQIYQEKENQTNTRIYKQTY